MQTTLAFNELPQGRKFSIQGLLNETCSSEFVNGSLVIFRLAPQVEQLWTFFIVGAISHY